MDEIRKTEKRPTVALVLSGGGAKGAAQAGALQFLEDQNIPVDMVCGTSIGGLLGGLYAVGYTSSDMRELFCTQDWGITLTDKIQAEHIPYSTRIRHQKFVINVPFHYAKEDFSERLHENAQYSTEEDRMRPDFGANDAVENATTPTNFASSLPTGYAYGFNVNNLLASLTVGYQDSISFIDLPVPYVCVATDMVSCKANNWTSGYLKTAMRSTMSIPGLFNPVRTDGMVLVDGGTRNNYPADIARACGADYIIGIELADAEPDYGQVSNLKKLVGQFIRMLGKDAYDENIAYPDVRVQPDLTGFNMLSFNAAAVDTMMKRGYDAIASKEDEIAMIKEAVGEAGPRKIRKAIDISKTPVLVKRIEFEGLDDSESKILMRRIRLSAGQKVDKEIMDDAMSRIQATGAFESVTYLLSGTEEPFDLIFHCVKGPTNELSLGLRIDQEEWAAVMLDLGINTKKLKGSKFDLSARLGRVQKVNARYSLDLRGLPTLNAEAGLNHCMYDIISSNGSMGKDTWEHLNGYARVFASNLAWTKVDFEVGAQYRYFKINTNRLTGAIIAALLPDDSDTGYFGFFANAKLYTMDDMYFPSKGVHLRVNADVDILRTETTQFTPYHSLGVDFKFVIPCGKVFTIIPDFHWRTCINNQSSYFHQNFVGGSVAGRYIDQQMPLVGTMNMVNLNNFTGVVNLDFRFNVSKNFYLSMRSGAARGDENISAFLKTLKPDIYAFEAQAAYDSFIGPLKFNVMWSNAMHWGVGFSLGFDF